MQCCVMKWFSRTTHLTIQLVLHGIGLWSETNKRTHTNRNQHCISNNLKCILMHIIRIILSIKTNKNKALHQERCFNSVCPCLSNTEKHKWNSPEKYKRSKGKGMLSRKWSKMICFFSSFTHNPFSNVFPPAKIFHAQIQRWHLV